MSALSESPRRRARPAVLTALTWCLAAAYPAVLYIVMQDGHMGFRVAEVAVALALTVVVFRLLRRRPAAVLALLLLAWTLALMAMRKFEVETAQVALTDAAIAYIAATRSRRYSLTAAGLTLLGQILSAAAFPPGVPGLAARREALDQLANDLAGRTAFIVLAMVALWMAGNSVRVRREHARELAARATAQAVAEERLRIARELHDMVAHSIGIIAIQAGVGSRVIGTQPAEARNALSAIEETSRDTLSGLRRMLGALRRAEPVPGTSGASDGDAAPRDPAPGLADLDRLAAATRDAGVRVEVTRLGESRPLPSDIDLSAFRIVQEAVTNVVRHAGTDRCRVTIDQRDGELAVEIVDDGRGHGTTSIGYGLVGMRERVGLLHGDLTAGPRPEGGFRVAARLPVPATAAAR
ncbi:MULTISPECIES: sensor histidine kinase [Actinomadura]|uniref:histidine kinase n=2 Tax=Actinomadura yumaensis TaxID=111807 RepID=A0ABW2D122_9ACTN|nr:histidine kinase [Actinomadura sp. J1-007]MWK38919.1 sensor histidine kinase [Actinomadura sp. J1-007]